MKTKQEQKGFKPFQNEAKPIIYGDAGVGYTCNTGCMSKSAGQAVKRYLVKAGLI